MRNKIFLASSFTLILMLAGNLTFAADSSAAILKNPLTMTMLLLMVLMAIIIGLLAHVLFGSADFKRTEEKKQESNAAAQKVILSIIAFLICGAASAQESTTTQAVVHSTIGGMSKNMFYTMSAVLFMEVFVIIALLINIKFLIKQEKETVAKPAIQLNKRIGYWWSKMNKFKSIEQEADIDLGHEYDGIRELDNRLPPWWLYGFYITIIFAGIYMWRFHVSHSGPSSQEEYEQSVVAADIKIKKYLAEKGEAVDENNVTILTGADDIAKGKTLFAASCAACHKADGGGIVGPNLTDDYWLHGGDVKSVFKTIRYGINAMPQWQNTYSNKEIAQITSFIKSIRGTNPAGAKAQQGQLFQEEGSSTVDTLIKK